MKRRLLLIFTSLVLLFSFSTVLLPASPTVSAAPASTGASTNADSPQLDVECGLEFDIDWMMCPVITAMKVAIAALDGFINSAMSIGSDGDKSDPNQIFCNKGSTGNARQSCDAYYKAWANIRNITLGLMVIAAIIILICQALGLEVLDAYTIRKALPRFLVCAVCITLSWQIMQFAVMLSNDLGFGIRYIIYQPFAGVQSVDVGGDSTALNIGSNAVVTLLGFTALNALGWIGLISYLLTALLAIFIAALVLLIRQELVILLVLMSSVGIACYILPITEKFFKFWRFALIGALFLFVLVSGLIATGRVASAMASVNSSSPLSQLTAFSLYFLPYPLIPAVALKIGGLMGQITGFISDRGRGMFSRLSKQRSDNAANRVKRARTGGIYRDDFGQFKFRPGGKSRSIGSMANAFGNWTFDFDEQARVSAGQFPVGSTLFGRGSDIMKGEIEDARIEHSKKAAGQLDLHYQSGRAISGQMQYFTGKGPLADYANNEYRQQLDARYGTSFATDEMGRRYATAWRGARGKGEVEEIAGILSHGDTSARLAAQELEAKAPEIGNFKAHEDTRRADIETVGLIAAAKAGRLENSEIVARRNAMQEEPGRIIDRRQQPGYAAKEMALLQDLATQKRTSQSRGHGIQFDESGAAFDVYADPTSTEAQNSLMRINTQDIAASKSEDIDSLAQTMIYGASLYKMKNDPNNPGHVTYELDENDNRIERTGVERQRAEALRSRIESLSLYSYGDSDVGRKLANVASTVELPLRSSSSGVPLDPQRAADGARRPEPPPEAPAP